MQRGIATNIVAMYLKQDFLPAVNAAISQAVSEKKVMRHMSGIISKHMALGMIKSTINNSNEPSKQLQQKISMSEDKGNRKQEDKLKVPRKKEKRTRNKSQQQFNIGQEREDSDTKSHISQLNTNSSSMLVKLPQPMEEDSDIAEIRKIKERLYRFNKQKEERGSFNQNKRKSDYQRKKKHAGDCLYHTYDYQSNPLAIVQHELEPTYNSQDAYRLENSSLLVNVQNHLEDQIELAKLRQKQKQPVQSRKVPSHLKKHIIPQYEMPNSHSMHMKAINPQVPFQFHVSNIDSLSKDMEKFLSQGIKMITHEEKIVQQKDESKMSSKIYKVKEEKVVKEKLSQKKSNSPKSHASSSVIYSLEQQSKSCCNNRKQTAEQLQNAHSVQLNRQIEESRFQPITQILRKHDKKYTIDLSTASRADIKLPNINMFIKDKSMAKKRTATEQKMIKGLSSIEVDIKPRQKDSRIEHIQRSGLFSAFHIHKPTESSLDEMDSQRPLLSNRNRPKKQFLKDYFNNYRQQFRHRMDSLSKVPNLYT